MNIPEFTAALTRLSHQKLGLKEAAILFACANGATTGQLSTQFGIDSLTTHGRLAVLRKKCLIESRFSATGTRLIYPSKLGFAVIKATIPTIHELS